MMSGANSSLESSEMEQIGLQWCHAKAMKFLLCALMKGAHVAKNGLLCSLW